MKWTPAVLVLGLSMAACITRPVGSEAPTTKVNFTSTQSQQSVDKVDLLFAIDNSASMGDKQALLADAVPNLLQGLLFPRCIDPDTDQNVDDSRADPTATKADYYGCKLSPTGRQLEAEFRPVTDLHIGIVSSSLGSMGGGLNGPDVCDQAKYGGHRDDRGHLLTRVLPSDPAVDAPAGFLAWFPQSEESSANPGRHPTPANPIADATSLESYFQTLVRGTAQDGCGLEAQLESMYRFLIQPDPYTTIQKNGTQADLGTGIDWDLLAERAAFLRPDSLVAVVMLTDEDDSSADPLSVDGHGFDYASQVYPGSTVDRSPGDGKTAPKPTSICATDPASPDCRPSAELYAPDDDDMNVRFFRMKERFGVDPQFPISRYVTGLSGPSVPDRSTEHTITVTNGVRQVSDYVGAGKCTNPLFASALPTKPGDEPCRLPRGTRDPNRVFFAIVGGVPNQLLYGVDADGKPDYRPNDPDANAMTPAKWTKVLGRDPLHYDTTGIDPHMVQSITPRPGIPGDPTSARGSNGPDPIVGRDWSTNKRDLQYACTFDLKEPRNCAQFLDAARTQKNPEYPSCDCTDVASPLTNEPLCQAATTSVQTKAKAYPTIRELEVARALGPQGITASLCPLDPALTNKADPTYGYNPAVATIVDRLKKALVQECLPHGLRVLPDGGTTDPKLLAVPCLILAQLAPDAPQDCAANELEDTDAEVLKVFHEQQNEEARSPADIAIANRKVCTVPQVVEQPGQSCKESTDRRWCYVENEGTSKPAGRCQQAVVFSAGTQELSGARFSLQCIHQFAAGAGPAAND